MKEEDKDKLEMRWLLEEMKKFKQALYLPTPLPLQNATNYSCAQTSRGKEAINARTRELKLKWPFDHYKNKKLQL